MKKFNIILVFALFSFLAESVFALSGNEILKRAEETINAPKDQTIQQTMTLIKAGGSEKSRTLMFYQKGSEQRLIVFLSPADIKGVGFLSLPEDRRYLYMPAFRKIRRIASHIKNEDFVGTDFSYEDLSETQFTEDYTATSEKSEANRYVLVLRPRPEADVSYSKQRVWVDKETFLPVKKEYYSKTGNLIKVLESENIKEVDGYWIAMKISMETLRTGHRTILVMAEIKYDTGLKDRFFTTRNLKKLSR
jgi:outer membrane lipoprotein-sorting protein